MYVGGHASDVSGKLFASGFGCLIAIQSAVNISVVTMLIPNTGLTLPFVSYGLSSLVSLYAGIGVVLNIGMQRKKNLYEEVRY
jgi:rod shape determining protein RodA